ncbi:MAG: methyltransferase [Alphaproteobacteria bacterium]|nr:methyltransferase [Alphaproteobacteria bacterium]
MIVPPPLHAVIAAAEAPEAFIRDSTVLTETPLVPEIPLHVASEVVPLWHLTEEELGRAGLPPPFWAFAWAGGQALARYLLDHPERVRGKVVLDFGAGSGLVAIAAARAGASHVLAADIDPFALAAIRLNARANGVRIEVTDRDLVGDPMAGFEVVLAGDVFYERPTARAIESWLRMLAGTGRDVLVGDPRRSFFPGAGMRQVTAYAVKTTREIEDSDVRNAAVWELMPAGADGEAAPGADASG